MNEDESPPIDEGDENDGGLDLGDVLNKLQAPFEELGEWCEMGSMCFFIRAEDVEYIIHELRKMCVRKKHVPDLVLKIGNIELKRFELLKADVQCLVAQLNETGLDRGWFNKKEGEVNGEGSSEAPKTG